MQPPPSAPPLAPPPLRPRYVSDEAALAAAIFVGCFILCVALPCVALSIMSCFFQPLLRRTLLRCGLERLADRLAPDLEATAAFGLRVHDLNVFMAAQRLPALRDVAPVLNVHDVRLGARNLLGCGGYGNVLRATLHGAPVLVNELFPRSQEQLVPLHVRHRIKLEAHTLCSLNHPHVLRIFGVVLERGWLVLGVCAPGTLKSLLLDPEQRMPPVELLRLAAETATGLAYLHMSEAARSPLVHGHLMAHNVLLSAERVVRLSVFGSFQTPGRLVSTSTGGTPRAGLQAGAAGPRLQWWKAPELLRSNGVKTLATDVFALGVTLWEIFERDTTTGDARNEPSGTPRVSSLDHPPPAVAEIMRACAEPDPKQRPRVAEVACALSELLHAATLAIAAGEASYKVGSHVAAARVAAAAAAARLATAAAAALAMASAIAAAAAVAAVAEPAAALAA
jgi:hypothetical protein